MDRYIVWISSIAATKGMIVKHAATPIFARSKAEATGIALQLCYELFPEKLGFGDHKVSIQPIEEDLLRWGYERKKNPTDENRADNS